MGDHELLSANRQPFRRFLKSGDPFAEREPFFLSLHFPDLYRFPVEDYSQRAEMENITPGVNDRDLAASPNARIVSVANGNIPGIRPE